MAFSTEETNSPKKTFAASFSVTITTAAKDLVSVQAAAGKIVRLRRVVLDQVGETDNVGQISTIGVGVADAVGSGGASATPGNAGVGDGDAASTSTARTGDTTQAANFVEYTALHAFVPQTTIAAFNPHIHDIGSDWSKSLTVSGDLTKKAIVVRCQTTGGAGASGAYAGHIIWTEE